jgi:hypothetical protein
MLGLPKSTEFNRFIPKQKFYKALYTKKSLPNKTKNYFVKQIKSITWENKIDHTTMNIAKGSLVEEIEVFRVELHDYEIDDSVLYIIDENIPYHILFVFEYNNKKKYLLSYKEISREARTINIHKIFQSDWISEDEDLLKFSGISLDDMYENLLNSISNNVLDKFLGDTLKERVLSSIEYEKIQKQVNNLSKKIKKEKQFNRQVELNTELKELNKKISSLLK